MEITLGQQYNVEEKPDVILYTYINRHAGTPEKHLTAQQHQKQCSTPSHMVVVIYYLHVRDIRNGLWDKESVVFRDFEAMTTDWDLS